ncbi:MAG TPA: hypothetical protein VN041_08835, partial [Microbacterium sp.]|nr:hypothetical protein [Microbacterium sp.]
MPQTPFRRIGAGTVAAVITAVLCTSALPLAASPAFAQDAVPTPVTTPGATESPAPTETPTPTETPD